MEISAVTALPAITDAPHAAPKPDALRQSLETAISNLSRGSAQGFKQTDTALLRTLLQALQSSSGNSGTLGPLLADLVQAQKLETTPPLIRAEIDRTLAVASPLRNLQTDTDIAHALLTGKAQLDTRAGTSPAQPMAQQATLASELKVALTGLQQALQQWTVREGIPVPPSTGNLASPGLFQAATPPGIPAQPSASPAPAPGKAIAPQMAVPATTPPGTPSTTAAARPVVTSAPVDPATFILPLGMMSAFPNGGTAPHVGGHGGMADAMVSFLLSQQAAATPPEALQRLRNAKLATPADGKSDLAPGTTNPAVSAYRKALPAAPVQPTTLWPHDPGPSFIARTLVARTEAALTQVKILEVTAQLQRAEQNTGNAQVASEPRWTFDLPLQTPFGHALARFEVSRDSFRTRNGAHASVWRARFSMEVEPLGPVHAQIALMGSHAWVSLWAERSDSMHVLEQQQANLRDTFSADSVEAEIICCLGKPPARPTGTGTVWDNAV